MTNIKTKILASLVIAGLLVVASLFALSFRSEKVQGSVNIANEYHSTTTPQVADRTNLCPKLGENPNNVGSSTTGVLGSVNILGYGAGELLLLNATTSDGTLRATAATSSLILAWFPVGMGTSTVHFDIAFTKGLFVDYSSGVGTSTITYRCYQ